MFASVPHVTKRKRERERERERPHVTKRKRERERERERENLYWTIKWESKFSWIVSYGERNGIYLPLVEICWFYKCKCSTNPILVFYSKYIIAPHDTGFEKWGFTVMVATVVLKPSLFE